MSAGWELAAGIAALAGATYALRVAGPLLRRRIQVSEAASATMERAVIVLLVAVALTGALYSGEDFAGWARPLGVSAGIVAALCRAPLAVVVIVAAGATAGLRAMGIA